MDYISGLPLYELTTPANTADSAVDQEILAATNNILSLRECTFLGDKGCDVKAVYHLVKDIYQEDAKIPLNKRNTKRPEKLSANNSICDAGLAMHKDGKTTDNGHTRQKFCCPIRQSKTCACTCYHKNWNTGTTERKTEAAPNTRRSPLTTGFPLTNLISPSREPMPCERNAKDIIPASKASGLKRLWVRNANSAANLNSMAHISALAVALAAVLLGSHFYRPAKRLRDPFAYSPWKTQFLAASIVRAHILPLWPMTSIPPLRMLRFAHLYVIL